MACCFLGLLEGNTNLKPQLSSSRRVTYANSYSKLQSLLEVWPNSSTSAGMFKQAVTNFSRIQILGGKVKQLACLPVCSLDVWEHSLQVKSSWSSRKAVSISEIHSQPLPHIDIPKLHMPSSSISAPNDCKEKVQSQPKLVQLLLFTGPQTLISTAHCIT